MSRFPWIRLDVSLPRNPKILALIDERDGRAAAFVYVCGLTYCGEQGTDGFIPKHALPLLLARQQDARRLVEFGLWHEIPGGWQVNDWDNYNRADESVKARSERARKAAQARWSREESK